MAPYLFSEDQRPSLLFSSFTSARDNRTFQMTGFLSTKEFSMRMPSFSSIYFSLSLNVLQIISMLPSHMEFHSVLCFKNTRDLTHHS